MLTAVGMAVGMMAVGGHSCRSSGYLVMVAIIMTIKMMATGVTVRVIVTAVMTWKMQIDWGHLFNRQRDYLPDF